MAAAANPFFGLFTPEGRAVLEKAAERRTFKAGALLFPEAGTADGVYVIEGGEVELFASGAVIGVVEAGKFFGELGVLTEVPRTVGARALGEVETLFIPTAVVRGVLEGEPGKTALAFLRRTVGYLKDANERFASEHLRKGKLELVGEMARSIIHDFRNPLGTVDLVASLLTEKHDDPQTQASCKSVHRQVERMAGMLQDLLDFASGEVTLDLRPVRIDDLLQEVRDSTASRLRHSGATLKLVAEPFVCMMDDRRILRSLENLIQNSIQAFAGKPGAVTLSATARGGRLEISVTDDGPGIPPEVSGTLFEPFVSHGKGPKSGLGLSVVKRVVEAHGGGVEARSLPEGGTHITLSLPLVSAAGQDGRTLAPEVPVKKTGPRPTQPI
ncbi:cyclic nucleotide-binding domain-containing protein [bacterium]|nr:MAG: cyclic nucleotide-binding domain-containing protein [bacterium]